MNEFEITRISETKGYEGDKDGFAQLNAAIWKQAIHDEFRKQRIRLFYDITEKVFTCLLHYPKEKRDSYAKTESIVGSVYGAAGIKIVRNIENLILSKHDSLLSAIKDKVYNEALNWPDNPIGKKDPEFEKKYYVIRDNILDQFSGRAAI